MRLRSLFFGLMMFASGAAWSQAYTVVANDIGTTSLSRADLKSVFKPKNVFWPNRKPVVIVLPGNQSPIRDVVAKDIYGMSYIAMQKYWLSLVFQGRFNAPTSLNTDEEVITFIRKTPGAIGFITDASVALPNLIITIKD